MKRIIALLVAAGLCGAASANASALAQRHADKNIGCAACHKADKPAAGAEVASSACLACHPRDKIVSKYSALGPKNPHNNHLGEIDCTVCHSGHGQSKVYCTQCHQNTGLTLK